MFRKVEQVGGAPARKYSREQSRAAQKVVPLRARETDRQHEFLYGRKKVRIPRNETWTNPSSAVAIDVGERCLQLSDALLQKVLDSGPTSMMVLDEDGTILQTNAAWRRYADRCGFMADGYGVGLDYFDAWQEALGPFDENLELVEGIQRILKGVNTEFRREFYYCGPVAPQWILVRAARFDLPGTYGSFRVLVTIEDLTPPVPTVAAAQDGEEHLRDVLNHIFAFVAVLAPDGTVMDVNRAPVEAAGMNLNEVEGKKFWDCHWWTYDARVQAQLRDVCEMAASGATVRRDLIIRRADQRSISIDLMVAPLKNDAGRITHLIASAVDITERRAMEEELRDLSGRLIGVQEAERRRIARELHDDLSQRMAILSIELQQLDQAIPKRKRSLHTCIQDLWVRAQEISGGIHHLSYQLHPSKLDHLGLVAAVKDCCDEVSEHRDLNIEFRPIGFPAPLPKEVALCVFRIAQESLQNIVKHSGARQAVVVLEKTEQAVRLVVADEGCGFDPEAARISGGLGLISMRERLRLVGGEVTIQSEPSRGTRVNVSVPLTTPS